MFVKHCNQYSYANNFQFCSTCSNNHKIITSCFISIQVDAERKILYTHWFHDIGAPEHGSSSLILWSETTCKINGKQLVLSLLQIYSVHYRAQVIWTAPVGSYNNCLRQNTVIVLYLAHTIFGEIWYFNKFAWIWFSAFLNVPIYLLIYI